MQLLASLMCRHGGTNKVRRCAVSWQAGRQRSSHFEEVREYQMRRNSGWESSSHTRRWHVGEWQLVSRLFTLACQWVRRNAVEHQQAKGTLKVQSVFFLFTKGCDDIFTSLVLPGNLVDAGLQLDQPLWDGPCVSAGEVYVCVWEGWGLTFREQVLLIAHYLVTFSVRHIPASASTKSFFWSGGRSRYLRLPYRRLVSPVIKRRLRPRHQPCIVSHHNVKRILLEEANYGTGACDTINSWIQARIEDIISIHIILNPIYPTISFFYGYPIHRYESIPIYAAMKLMHSGWFVLWCVKWCCQLQISYFVSN